MSSFCYYIYLFSLYCRQASFQGNGAYQNTVIIYSLFQKSKIKIEEELISFLHMCFSCRLHRCACYLFFNLQLFSLGVFVPQIFLTDFLSVETSLAFLLWPHAWYVSLQNSCSLDVFSFFAVCVVCENHKRSHISSYVIYVTAASQSKSLRSHFTTFWCLMWTLSEMPDLLKHVCVLCWWDMGCLYEKLYESESVQCYSVRCS